MKKALNVAEAKSISTPGSHYAGETLYLVVSPGGSKSWVQRVTINGRRCDIGLGGFSVVSLAEARDKAYQNRKLAREGGDPLAEKHKIKELPTFMEAAEKTFEANRSHWRNEKTAKNWKQGMGKHVLPKLGRLRVDQIRREDVLRVLTPIWTKIPSVARKQRQRIRTVLAWCQAHGYIEHNVAGEMINAALPAMPSVKQHFRALPYSDLPAALEIVDASNASMATRLCLQFLVLTAMRSGEARGASWSEIDIEAKTWNIPGSRMKTGVEHRVPLSDAALEVLEQAKMLRDRTGRVFPSGLKPGKQLSDATLLKVLKDNGLADKTTVHGLRSTFRDWCSETGKPREVAEAALAHVVPGVEGAYFRSDLFERRRQLMDQWGAYATRSSTDVVSQSWYRKIGDWFKWIIS